MSSELTPELGLFKAVPGTGEPFRTSDLNDNADLIDAAFVADRERLDTVESAVSLLGTVDGEFDARLDVVEANGWVTSNRIASGAVVAGKLASNSVSDSNLQFGLSASKLTFGTLNPALIPDGSLSGAKLASSLDLLGKYVTVPDNYDGQAAASVNVATALAASAAGAVSGSVYTSVAGLVDSRVGELLLTKSFNGSAPSLSSGDVTTIVQSEYRNLRIVIRPTTVGSLNPTVAFYSGTSGTGGPATIDSVARTFGSTSLTTTSATTLSLGTTASYHPYIVEVRGVEVAPPNTTTAYSRIGSASSYSKVLDLRISGIPAVSKVAFTGTWTSAVGTVEIYGWN